VKTILIKLKWKYSRWIVKRNKLSFRKMMARMYWIQELEKLPQYDVEKLPKGLWIGDLLQTTAPQDMSTLLEERLFQLPIHISAKRRDIKRIAWCSGAAQDFLEQASQLGADAYLSGEISERTFDLAKELNIHYYACGHHATERYGVQALAVHLEQKFGIEHRFIDTNNPI
jgi:putative NIF3 family GTP cyclohydrolase 1 type 2